MNTSYATGWQGVIGAVLLALIACSACNKCRSSVPTEDTIVRMSGDATFWPSNRVTMSPDGDVIAIQAERDSHQYVAFARVRKGESPVFSLQAGWLVGGSIGGLVWMPREAQDELRVGASGDAPTGLTPPKAIVGEHRTEVFRQGAHDPSVVLRVTDSTLTKGADVSLFRGGTLRWNRAMPSDQRLVAAAVSPSAEFAAIGLVDERRVKQVVVLAGSAGKVLWRGRPVASRGAGMMFFSGDGARLAVTFRYSGSKCESCPGLDIYRTSDGKLLQTVELESGTPTAFDLDDRAWGGFSGDNLWFFLHSPRSSGHSFGIFGRGGPAHCRYSVYDLASKKGKRVRSMASGPVGEGMNKEACDVMALMPTPDGGLVAVRYVDNKTLRVHRMQSPP